MVNGSKEVARLAELTAAARRILSTRYGRRSAYCGGSDAVPDGVDARLLRPWLERCAAYAAQMWGAQSVVARRLAARLEREPSVEEVEGALADLAGTGQR